MAKRRVDLDTRVLCERCGYDLSGVGAEGSCPECGKAIAESLPGHRTGTAWQRDGWVRGWWGTLKQLVVRDQRMWAEARVERGSGFRLAVVNGMLNGLIMFAAVIANEYLKKFPFKFTGMLELMLFGSLVALMVAGPTMSLTAIEYRGIRFFGNRRGWRISKGVGWTVVGHASYGWLVSGVLCGMLLLGPVRIHLPWSDAQVPILLWHVDGYLLTQFAAACWGMLVFEILVYLGVRRMRYANPPTPPV